MSKPVPALSRGREPTRVRCITAPPPPRRKARRSRRQSERGALWHKSETRAICWSRPGFTCAGPHTSPPFASPFASYSRDGGRRTADELMHDRSSCEPRPMWVTRECPTGNQLHRRSRACFGWMTSRSWCIAAAGCSNRDCRSSASSEEQGSQRRGVASLRFANLGHLGDRLGVDGGGRIELAGALWLAELLEAASTSQAVPQRAAATSHRRRGSRASATAQALSCSM
jgi:hypothetical protein